ncbi:hypothetical protein VKT23_009898 [Stygiomarasmius scandens]|uniref:Uncharacterized protein n=1 Tax=Marasmiellus scandens TaxID=2682957 RepID=A0ABR1JGC8_9AGAR
MASVIPAKLDNLITMQESYAHTVALMISLRMIDEYEEALENGKLHELIKSVCQRLGDRLHFIEEANVNKVIAEALQEASYAIDEPFMEEDLQQCNDAQREDSSDYIRSDYASSSHEEEGLSSDEEPDLI